MKLGELIKQYRDEHGYSQRKMAEMIGCSYAYVGMLEKGINPKTQRELSPTLDIFKKTADAFGIELDTLLKRVDGDQPITVAPAPDLPKLNAKDEREITRLMDDMKDKLMQEEGLMFDGEPASPESIQSILDAMQIGMEMAKKRNKAKYTPKKYRPKD